MRRILIKYDNKEVPAFLLARFHMVENELVPVKGLFGRRKDIFTPLERQYCLVFIPWKHQVKELVLISMRDIITMDELDGNDVVSVKKYMSPFTEEAPYYVEYKITDFVGYKLVYDYKNFIADIRNQCFTKPLELLYQHYPELLQEEFEEERRPTMKIDVTLKITPNMLKEAPGNENKALVGHMGTHFDVMNKEFPLDYTQRSAIIFDVSNVKNRDIDVVDIELDKVTSDMFVAFYTGFIETEEYGTQRYFKEHPQLSNELIEALLKKNISIIGVDCAGIRRGKEHTPIDQYCADRGVFVIENLCNLKTVVDASGPVVAHTYPINYTGITGLPCRVIMEV